MQNSVRNCYRNCICYCNCTYISDSSTIHYNNYIVIYAYRHTINILHVLREFSVLGQCNAMKYEITNTASDHHPVLMGIGKAVNL